MAGNGGVWVRFCAVLVTCALAVVGLVFAPPLVEAADAVPSDEAPYVPITPERIIDSRPTTQTGPYGTAWGAGQTRTVNVTTATGVPATGVDAVAVNVTTVAPTAGFSWLTIFPTGSARPTAASINFGTADYTSQITNDFIVTKVDANGNFSIYNHAGSVHLVIDIVGYHSSSAATASRYTAVSPERIIDSRPATQVGPLATPWGAGQTRTVNATAAAGVPPGVDAVAVNVTTVGPTAGFSWLTIFPTGSAQPTAASLNFGTAEITSQITNDFIVTKVDASGNFSIYNHAGNVDLVIDIVGYYSSSGAAVPYTAVTPERIIDSRPASQAGPYATAWGAGQTRTVNATDALGVPAINVDAVAINVTTVAPTAGFSWLTIFPTGSAQPTAASLNFGTAEFTSQITNDLIITKIDAGGNFSVFNHAGNVHLVIDIVGYYSSDASFCNQQAAAPRTADATLSAGLATLTGPDTPGIVAGSVSSAGVIRVGAAGVRQIGTTNTIQANDRMHLGSDTKSMTGALLAMLHDQGILSFDDTVTDIWPSAGASWSNTTMLSLVQHRGGVDPTIPAPVWSAMWASDSLPWSTPLERAQNAADARIGFVNSMISAPPPETVGGYAYSNGGYIMAGAAMEKVTGLPWEELMCKYLFEAAGMQSCGFGSPPDPAPWAHRVVESTLTPIGPTVQGSDNPAGLGPAGTVHCPMDAWGGYLAWVLRGTRGTNPDLSASSWSTLLTAFPDPARQYAAGWGVANRTWAGGDSTVYVHAGSNTQWYAIAWVAPGIDRVFFSVTNAATPEATAATDAAVGQVLALDG